MDNLTHSVIGFVAGSAAAAIHQAVRRGAGLDAPVRRVAFIALGVVGGNLPDSDLLVSYGEGKLGYLLQHRGYTHTLIGALLLAAVLYGAVLAGLRFRRCVPDRSDRVALALMTTLAVALHLGMDYLNNYGLHPFWPIANDWHYGDAVFIVEPAYWIAAAPLWFGLRALGSRIALGAPLVLAVVALAVVHASPAVPIVAALAVAGLLAFGRWRPGAPAVASSALLTVAVTATFVLGGTRAASAVERAAQRDFPGEQLLDHVLTPAPSMPACWDVLLLQRTASSYIARRGRVVLAPAADTMRCPQVFGGDAGSAPWDTLPASTGRVRWLQELRFPVERFATAVKGHCEAEALMQFARAPFVVRAGAGWLVGDLRFDREAGPGFAEVEVGTADPQCPSPAPWLPPRGDLLR